MTATTAVTVTVTGPPDVIDHAAHAFAFAMRYVLNQAAAEGLLPPGVTVNVTVPDPPPGATWPLDPQETT